MGLNVAFKGFIDGYNQTINSKVWKRGKCWPAFNS